MPTILHLFQRRPALATLCLALIALADFLFFDHPLGFTAALFAAALLLAILLRAPRLLTSIPAAFLVLATATLLLALAEEPTPLAIALMLLALATLAILSHEPWTTSLLLWAGRYSLLILATPLRFLADEFLVGRWFLRHPSARPAFIRITFRWIIPLLGGAGFIALFTLANPVLEQFLHATVTTIVNCLEWLPLFLNPPRIALWLAVGTVAYALLRYRPLHWKSLAPAVTAPPVVRPPTLRRADPITRALIIFNAAFLLQTSLDAFYLLAGAPLPRGLTYAQYAHRGAYPLVATTLLAALFVLLAFRTDGPAHRSSTARRLVYIWLAQNIFLLFTTISRLWLYVDAYSLTRLRLAAIIWVALVAIGFLCIIYKIARARSNFWLLRANVVAALAALYLLAFINTPGLIADFNVRHCQEFNNQAAPLDLAYLRTLGPAALPALHALQPRLFFPKSAHAVLIESQLTRQLQSQIHDWRGWTLRRSRIAIDLKAHPLRAPHPFLAQQPLSTKAAPSNSL